MELNLLKKTRLLCFWPVKGSKNWCKRNITVNPHATSIFTCNFGRSWKKFSPHTELCRTLRILTPLLRYREGITNLSSWMIFLATIFYSNALACRSWNHDDTSNKKHQNLKWLNKVILHVGKQNFLLPFVKYFWQLLLWNFIKIQFINSFTQQFTEKFFRYN